MNEWHVRANELRASVRETEDWIRKHDWEQLPDGFQMVICRGIISVEELIKKYEAWAK